VDEIRKLEDKPPLPNGEGEDYTPIMPGAAIPAADPKMDPKMDPSGTVIPIREWANPT
jgi:hypothetical protein